MERPYTYTSLPEIPDSKDIFIRLLVLPPGDQFGPISCQILYTRLSKAPQFEALSYCWGKDESTIYITGDLLSGNEQGNEKILAWFETSFANDAENEEQKENKEREGDAESRLLQVPTSLIPFLHRTRARGQERIFWIDSVCINQSDNLEKASQVSRMRDIYVKAMRTLLWLGPSAPHSSQALDYAVKLTNQDRYEHDPKQVKKPDVKIKIGDPNLEGLFELLDRAYFERAWIVQEVVVSKECWVVVGPNSLRWEWFLLAIIYLLERQNWIWEFYPGTRMHFLLSMRVSAVEWGARQKGKEGMEQVRIEWWRLLIRHRRSLATDPRDKVFAFRGLVCEEQFEEMNASPAYGDTNGVEGLYWKLAVTGLKRGQVEIFGIPRLVISEDDRNEGVRRLDMPSWVPDWRWTKSTPEPLQRFGDANLNWKPPYAASSFSPFPAPFEQYEGKDSETLPTELRLSGYPIGTITHITPRAWTLQQPPGRQTLRDQAFVLQYNQHQIIEWEKILRLERLSALYAPTGETNLEAEYKTLMTGILLGQSETLTRKVIEGFEFRQRFLRLFVLIGIHRFLWPYILVVILGHFLRYFGIKNPEWAFRASVPTITNHKAARLVSGTGGIMYLGMVPSLCDVGDTVVVASGVKVPLVLRKRSASQELEKGVKWEFLGDAYVHGVMKGEAWKENRCEDLWIV